MICSGKNATSDSRAVVGSMVHAFEEQLQLITVVPNGTAEPYQGS